MTELLYMKDNYIKEFDARVIETGEGYVVLDRTAFYPEGGGQSGDRGSITDGDTTVRVTSTKKKAGAVRHKIDGNVPFEVGTEVKGTLDWERRHECMRFHTCQHILSRFLQLNYGLETVGNMIKPNESRADYSPLDEFSDEMKKIVEVGVNEILDKELEVKIRFMPREEATTFLEERGYQTRYLEMVPKSVKEFRVMIIGDYDVASCAGTHVSNTREIGHLQINKTKNVGAGKQRIYFSLVQS